MKPNKNSGFGSRWKILFPILLGVGISFFLLFQAFNEVHFFKVRSGEGAFEWVDGNNNDLVDYHLISDFKKNKQGDYIQLEVTNFWKALGKNENLLFAVILGIFFMVGRDFFYMVRIRLLTKNTLSWKKALRVILLWEYASALSPGTVGGSGVAMFILQREKIPLGKSTTIIIITALMDNLFYVLFIPFTLLLAAQLNLFQFNDIAGSNVLTAFWVGYGLVFMISSFLFISLFYFPSIPKKVFSTLFRLPYLVRWREQAISLGDDIRVAALAFRKEPKSFWFKVFWATVGSWISRFLVINALVLAIVSLTFDGHLALLLKQFILWLLMLVSPTPGASGIAEFAFTKMLSGYSVPEIVLASMAILWRLVSYFPYLIIGSIILPRWLKSTAT